MEPHTCLRASPPPNVFEQSSTIYDNFGYPIEEVNDKYSQTRRLADKLRKTISKGYLDMEILVNSAHIFTTRHAEAIMKLLNEMFDHLAHLESLEMKAKQAEMYSDRKKEFEQLQANIAVIKAELGDYREKIHAALSQKAGKTSTTVAKMSSAEMDPQQDWTQFGEPGDFQQPPPMYDSFGQPIPQQNDKNSQIRHLADKLRMAASQGLLDLELLVNSAHVFRGPGAENTMKLLNELFDRLAMLEELEMRSGAMNRVSEFYQIRDKIGIVKAELEDICEKIHAALSQKSG